MTIPQPAIRPGDTTPVFRRREGHGSWQPEKLWGVALKVCKTYIVLSVRRVTSLQPALVDGALCYQTESDGVRRLDYVRGQTLFDAQPVTYATDGDGENGRYVCELWPEGADAMEARQQVRAWEDARAEREGRER
jgi:hypothetical protein